MKTTLANLVNPHGYGTRISEDAFVLGRLLKLAHGVRWKALFGSFGPTELLNGHHSSRSAGHLPCEIWLSGKKDGDAVKKTIIENILTMLCCEYPDVCAWREKHAITLETEFKASIKEGSCQDECTALGEFAGLHGFKLPHSLNPCHDDVDTLCFPTLVIAPDAVRMSIEVTSQEELTRSQDGCSRWGIDFLSGKPLPQWKWSRETFEDFIRRGIRQFKDAQQRKNTK